jgi:hypothetical protein
MRSLCHVIDKCYNAVVALSGDRQVGYKVNADSLAMAFGHWKWLQEAHGFSAPVIGSMAQVTTRTVSLGVTPHFLPEISVLNA